MSGIRQKEDGKRLYSIWRNMIRRCSESSHISFKYYGARGIRVCNEWTSSFENFYQWAMNNGYECNLTIDRINNDGNYEPSNCRWVTMKVQCNNRSNNTTVTINNETKSLSDWCESLGLNYDTILGRIENGMSPVNALRTPVKTQNKFDKVTIKNETHSIYEWCKIMGINYDSIKSRIYKGMSPVEALKKEIKSHKRYDSVTIGKETHLVKEWCKIIGIKYATVKTRIRRGMNPVDALTTPVRGKKYNDNCVGISKYIYNKVLI